MKDLAGIDHGLEPTDALRRTLHRHQQRQQLLSIGSAGVFAQGLAERHMLGPRLGRQARGVGGQEGKGPFRVAAVLGQIEVDTADQIPGRVQRLEESLQISSGCCECRGKCGAKLGPQPTQDFGGQVFRPRHYRGRQDECGEFGLGRRGNGGQDRGGRPLSGPTRPVKTDRLHIAYGEIAPPVEGGRQGLADLARSELQQPIPGATAKGLGQPCRHVCHPGWARRSPPPAGGAHAG